MPRMLVITHSDFDPSSRLRLMQYFPRFIAAGWRVDHRPLRPSPYRPLHFVKPTLRNWEIQVNAELRRANLLREFIFAGKYGAIMIGRELPNLIGFLKRLNPRLILTWMTQSIWGRAERPSRSWPVRPRSWLQAIELWRMQFLSGATASRLSRRSWIRTPTNPLRQNRMAHG